MTSTQRQQTNSVLPFEPWHIWAMDLRPSEIERCLKDPRAAAQLNALGAIGIGGTLYYDSKIIGVFGYIELWEGHYAVWAYPSVHVEQYAMIYLRTVKRYIQRLEKTHKPRRLQTEACADALHTGWMTFLGFKNETPEGMKNYSPLGETFNLWSKVYKDYDG